MVKEENQKNKNVCPEVDDMSQKSLVDVTQKDHWFPISCIVLAVNVALRDREKWLTMPSFKDIGLDISLHRLIYTARHLCLHRYRCLVLRVVHLERIAMNIYAYRNTHQEVGKNLLALRKIHQMENTLHSIHSLGFYILASKHWCLHRRPLRRILRHRKGPCLLRCSISSRSPTQDSLSVIRPPTSQREKLRQECGFPGFDVHFPKWRSVHVVV